MTLSDLAEWMTGVAAVLLFLAAGFVTPFAYRELRNDPRRLRGMFALAFAGICYGASFHLAIGWFVLSLAPGQRVAAILEANSYFIAACMVLAIFATLGIRMVTIGNYGEKAWVWSLFVATLIATLVVVLT